MRGPQREARHHPLMIASIVARMLSKTSPPPVICMDQANLDARCEAKGGLGSTMSKSQDLLGRGQTGRQAGRQRDRDRKTNGQGGSDWFTRQGEDCVHSVVALLLRKSNADLRPLSLASAAPALSGCPCMLGPVHHGDLRMPALSRALP